MRIVTKYPKSRFPIAGVLYFLFWATTWLVSVVLQIVLSPLRLVLPRKIGEEGYLKFAYFPTVHLYRDTPDWFLVWCEFYKVQQYSVGWEDHVTHYWPYPEKK